MKPFASSVALRRGILVSSLALVTETMKGTKQWN